MLSPMLARKAFSFGWLEILKKIADPIRSIRIDIEAVRNALNSIYDLIA